MIKPADLVKAKVQEAVTGIRDWPRTGKVQIIAEVSFADGGLSGLDVHVNAKEHFSGRCVNP